MPVNDRLITTRRTLQQIVHCAKEALGAHENKETRVTREMILLAAQGEES